MNLEQLLNASLELEKRIAQDQALRRCFAELWRESDHTKNVPQSFQAVPPSKVAPSAKSRVLALELPIEICRQLAEISERTGKTPSQILEDALLLYCRAEQTSGRSGGERGI